jgi:hypothetical protein
MWASRRNIQDASDTPLGIKRERYHIGSSFTVVINQNWLSSLGVKTKQTDIVTFTYEILVWKYEYK